MKLKLLQMGADRCNPLGFVLLSAVRELWAPAPCLWAPASDTVHHHVLSLASAEVLVISRCPFLVCRKKSQLALQMLSPKTASVVAFVGLSPFLLLWITETRPLVFLWTISTSNQLVMVFDISWEPGQDALILFFFNFFKISITFSGLLPTPCLVCLVHLLMHAPPVHCG